MRRRKREGDLCKTHKKSIKDHSVQVEKKDKMNFDPGRNIYSAFRNAYLIRRDRREADVSGRRAERALTEADGVELKSEKWM